MTDADFEEYFSWLEKYHKRSFSPTAREQYHQEFKTVDGDLFYRAINAWSKKHAPDSPFPNIHQLRGCVDDESERLQQRRHKEKIAEPDREQSKALCRILIAEIEGRDVERKRKQAERRELDRQESAARINAKKQALQEQARRLKDADDPKWVH